MKATVTNVQRYEGSNPDYDAAMQKYEADRLAFQRKNAKAFAKYHADLTAWKKKVEAGEAVGKRPKPPDAGKEIVYPSIEANTTLVRVTFEVEGESYVAIVKEGASKKTLADEMRRVVAQRAVQTRETASAGNELEI